jgi:hypothetical protein
MKKKLLHIAAKKLSFLDFEDVVLLTDLASDGSRNSIAVTLQQVMELGGIQNYNNHHTARPVSLGEADAAVPLKDYCALSNN